MAPFALVFGGLLIAVGLLGYFAPGTFGEYKDVSPTALIPAVVGAIIAACGVVVLAKPAARKHAMHLAALAGVVGAAGGFMPLVRSNFDFKKASAVSGMLMTGLSLLFVVVCVKSFIDARRNRVTPASGE